MALGIWAFQECWVDYKLCLGNSALQALCGLDGENSYF